MMKTFLVVSLLTIQTAFAAGVQSEAPASVPAVASPAADETVAAAPGAKLAEDQIPLNIETAKKPAEGGSTTAKALMSMVIILILTGSGYYFVRRYKFSNTINKSNMQIKVLSQHYLGPKKSLAIIHVAGESILVGVTDHNISMIKSLSLIDDEVPAGVPNHFGQALAKAEGGVEAAAPTADKAGTGQGSGNASAAMVPVELDEEFSFTNVTDTVSKKLRSMRSFS
ncbi:MAG: polar flagellar assembly protein FliO [Pseudobdellovibrio sp.]|jgi:flagellar protein FliO/FliZ|nr:polar flagellar assembly protein FliO [Pseudobdellovibrio sp.]